MNVNYRNVIYILTNPLYAGYIKIGYASDLNKRLISLNTGMLSNFNCFAVYETNVQNADIQLHKIIGDLAPIVRAKVVSGQKVQDKEFFKLDPEQAYDLLEHIAIMTGTQNKLHRMQQQTIKGPQIQQQIKKPPIDFYKCGLKDGDKLVCIEDASIVAEVAGAHKVLFNNQLTSLSAIMSERKRNPTQGTAFFTYNGELITDIAKRTQWQ